MKYYLKIHSSEERTVIGICDEEIIGKVFEDGELRLEISERFYKGELVEFEIIQQEIAKGNNFNIVGNNIIKELMDNDLIDKDSVKQISGISYTMVIEI